MTEAELYIERLGARGEGVAMIEGARVFVPYALAGETVRAKIDGEHAHVVETIVASPDRVAPICPYYGVCGGCAVQTLAPAAYAEWKRGVVVSALRNAGLDLDVAPLVDAHGAGRRRVTFHSRRDDGRTRVGFMRARSHDIVEIEACPLLAPELGAAPPVARALAQALDSRGKPLDIVVSATDEGLDVDLRGAGALAESDFRALTAVAERLDLARVANHGRIVTTRRAPRIAIGAASVAPPPGAFLQATQTGEETIAGLVLDGVKGAKRVADLFCGLGAFALRIAENASVAALDGDAPAIAALDAAAKRAATLRPVDAATRDLFRRPLSADELSGFDALVFDPPRAGAEAQARQIAASSVSRVVAVSCNAQTFAKDAKTLLAGGYSAGRVTPIDQFRFSPHVELVCIFERAKTSRRKRPGLLG